MKLASLSRLSPLAKEAGRQDWGMHLYHGLLGRKEHWRPCVDLMSGFGVGCKGGGGGAADLFSSGSGGGSGGSSPDSPSSSTSMLADVIGSYTKYDMRNHGATMPRTAKHSCDYLCADIDQSLHEHNDSDTQGLNNKKKNILVGHSMGGAAVMNYLVTGGRGSSRFRSAAVRGNANDSLEVKPSATFASVKAAVIVDMYPLPDRPFFADQAAKDLQRLVALGPELAELFKGREGGEDCAIEVGGGKGASDERQEGGRHLTPQLLFPPASAPLHPHDDVVEKKLKKIIYNPTLRKFVKDAIVFTDGGGGGHDSLGWEPNLSVMAADVEAFLKFPVNNTTTTTDCSSSSSSSSLPLCDIPVLFVYGAKSDYTQRNKSGQLNIPHYFSNFEEVVVPDAGHFVFHDQPEQFVDVVGEFVSKVVLTSGE